VAGVGRHGRRVGCSILRFCRLLSKEKLQLFDRSHILLTVRPFGVASLAIFMYTLV
jgi:hypothetical protein